MSKTKPSLPTTQVPVLVTHALIPLHGRRLKGASSIDYCRTHKTNSLLNFNTMHSSLRNPFFDKQSSVFRLCLALLWLCLSLPVFGQTLTWEKQYAGPTHGNDVGVKVKTDAAGNVYVVASSEEDILTIKYNPAGVQQWAVRYDSVFTSDQGTGLHTQDQATDLLVDAAGNAYVTGTSYFDGNCNKVSAVTLKYSSSGVRQWKVSNTATAACGKASQMQKPQLGTDSSGNLYLLVSYQAESNADNKIVLQKLTVAGNQVWKTFFDGSSGATTGVSASLLAVDANGNAYLGGQSSTSGLLLSYNNAGTLRWQKADRATGLKTDASGNVYVSNVNNLKKYNTAGGQQWQVTYDAGTYRDDTDGKDYAKSVSAGDLLVDASSNAFLTVVTYSYGNCNGTAAVVVKYNTQGVKQWENIVASVGCTTNYVSVPYLAMDGDGNLYVAVTLSSDNDPNQIKVAKYTQAGNAVWNTIYITTPYTVPVYAAALHADALGNAYVTGSVSLYANGYPTGGSDVLTLKYANPTLCMASGTILREVWTNVPGKLVSSIPVNTPANLTAQLTNFNTPAGYGDNYGQRIRGYLCPPVSGAYTFFIQGDDQAELYLSSDYNPANKQKIATVMGGLTWTGQPGQQSVAIQLVAGQRYYVEALHKENLGGDVLRVGWRTPQVATDATPVIIPGSVLSPYQNPTQAPADLSAKPYQPNGSIVVGWGDVRDETGYVLERATSASGPFTQLATLSNNSGSATYYSDLSVVTNTTYYYRVYATSAQGASAYSNVVSATLPCDASGTIYREVWTNVPGKLVSSIPLDTPPNITGQLTNFNTPSSYGDNYGQRIRGYICAPENGSYTFFIQGDDQAQLFLSTDDNPTNKRQIASVLGSISWTGQPSQQSAPITLIAGKKYYVEALHKENLGGDVLRVGWRRPQMAADATPVIIAGAYLSPFVPQMNGLLACYSFSGNANDGSGRGNNGTVHGGATLTSDRFGNANSAYAFDGVDDYITVAASQLQPFEYTYSVWAKPGSLPSSNTYYSVFAIGSFNADQSLILLNKLYGNPERTGWVVLSAATSGSTDQYTSGSAAAVNTWYHLVVTRDANQVKFYVNGKLLGSVATSAASPFYGYDPVTAYIGAKSGNYLFQGVLDDLQVYNYPLSATEVSNLYQKTGNLCPSNPGGRLSEETPEPVTTSLKAYPNPTTGTTTVEFTAAESGLLGVQLYNLQGQPLKQVFAEEVAAGTTYQRVLEGGALPEGLYVLRLVNGQHLSTQKLVIVH